MERKVASGIMLTLLLISMLILIFCDGAVKGCWLRGVNSNSDSWLADSSDLGFDVDSFAERRWSFERAREWSDFAYADEDSAELVIGVSDARLDAYAELGRTIATNGGKIVNTVSIKEAIWTVVADIPFDLIPSFVHTLEVTGLAKYIEPNMRFETQFIPNDPYWNQQWGPQKIEADWAWNTTTGDPSIIVAVIDTGIDHYHPDLATNYAALGYDWVNNDPDPIDDNGHGTHCAGIIAAELNNGIGISGLAQVKIMAEKGLDQYGGGYEDDLANAIIHAVDQGADILSNSWGGYGESALIYDAVKYAYDAGVLIVASAGNEAESTKVYPAAYDEVIAVTATDQSDNSAEFTNFGNWVEVAAPGVDIYSTMPTYHVTLNDPPYDKALNYDYLSGTSMACPHVAGVAALIWGQFPNMKRDRVRAQLLCTADDLGDSGFDKYYGYGRINARKAVEQAPSDHDLLIFRWKKPCHVMFGDRVTSSTTVLNFGKSNETDVEVRLLVNGSLVNSTSIAFLPSGTFYLVVLSWTPTIEGTYNVTSFVVPVLGETITQNNVISGVLITRPIFVPDDFLTIQKAVNNASEGDTVYVRSGIYYECVVVNETVLLIGENRDTTVIDGNWTGTVVDVIADGVTICGFMIQRSRAHFGRYNSGIYLESSNNNVSGNSIFNNGGFGIWLDYSNDNIIANNTVSNNGDYGIWLLGSSYNIFRDNYLADNKYNLKAGGYNDIDTSNMINGKPIYYLMNQANTVINPHTFPSIGYLALVNCTNITVENLELEEHNGEGVLVFDTSSSTIYNSKFALNEAGIRLVFSFNISVSNNTVINNEDSDIYLYNSRYNTISNNTIMYTDEGICIVGDVWDRIVNNNITQNSYGIYAGFGSENLISGNRILNNAYINLYLRYSYNTTVFNNTIANSNTGIFQYRGGNHTIYCNNIINNVYFGLQIEGPYNYPSRYGCKIFHNNFINNSEGQTGIYFFNATFDDGYPSGGNYWGDYVGQDLFSGPYQNETGSDGIGDTPYVMNANNRDRYPLMKPYPWSPHDIGITSVATSKTAVGQGCTLSVNITIFNYGNYTENFNVTAYANTTVISTLENITLTSKNSTTVSFVWNTSGFARGNYTMKAVADTVPNETDWEDNTFVDGVVRVVKAGDFGTTSGGYYDFDDLCNFQDLFLFRKAYAEAYHPLCDFDNDLDVDFLDLFQFRKCYIS